MPDQEEKNAIHPVAIFKQAWSVGWKNLGKLGALYVIFNLPITIISLAPAIRPLPDQKFSPLAALWFIFVSIIGGWGHVALLLGAQKATDAQDYSIGQSIGQSKALLVKYLTLLLSITLFILGIIMAGVLSAAVAWAFLSQVNKMLAVLICIILIILVIAAIVFFSLRWSLAALVCVFENVWPVSAVKGSFSLVKAHINPLVGIYGLMGLTYMAFMIPMIISGAILGAGQNTNSLVSIGTTIYAMVINVLLVPFWTMITVALYKKLKEVFGAHVYA